MTTLLKFNKTFFWVLVLLMFGGISSHAQSNLTSETVEPFKISITSGKSIVMKSDINVKRISIGSPSIADFILLSPKEIYIQGKTAGLTNMIIWQEGEVTSIYDIEVAYDLLRLKEKIHQILPDEKEIKIMSTNDSLTLSGRVSSAENLSQAMTLAKSYAPGGKINNLLSVGGTHQVMLEVTIAEVDRTVTKNLGIDLSAITEFGDVAVQLFSSFATGLAPGFGGGFQHSNGDTTLTGVINALKTNGQFKVLAEPNLIALSGQAASFLAGGEFPVPVPNDGDIAIEYKKWGVGLSFTPNVLSKDRISIKVISSVSEIDSSAGVQIGGYPAPGISTREVATMVELADGQSFAIAGLLRDTIRESIEKFPFLGDIPVLGTLFKSSSFQKHESELIIIVTPRLVKPINKETQPLPTDFYGELDDTQFYFNTDRPVGKSSKDGSADGNMDGQFGHSFEE